MTRAWAATLPLLLLAACATPAPLGDATRANLAAQVADPQAPRAEGRMEGTDARLGAAAARRWATDRVKQPTRPSGLAGPQAPAGGNGERAGGDGRSGEPR